MTKSSSAPPPLPPHWFQILLSLADRDLHGLAIMNDVLERTGGRMRLWPAMLYRNLARLVSEELVTEIDAPADVDPRGGRPRFYRISPLGRRACADEAQRLAAFVDVARRKKVIKA
jgi:DNA-binding PadR family transcriptional regulator